MQPSQRAPRSGCGPDPIRVGGTVYSQIGGNANGTAEGPYSGGTHRASSDGGTVRLRLLDHAANVAVAVGPGHSPVEEPGGRSDRSATAATPRTAHGASHRAYT